MEFDDSGEMYLTSIHPEATEAEIQEATGWELQIGDELTETQPPTEREIDLIRNDLDPDGIYVG